MAAVRRKVTTQTIKEDAGMGLGMNPQMQYPMGGWPMREEKSWVEKIAPVLMVLVMVMSFALGSLWSKVKYLEANAGSGNVAADAGAVKPAGVKYAKINDAIADLGKQAGLDTGKLLACVNSGEKAEIVNADFKQGGEWGVQGTPGFFVNGKFLGGAFPEAAFKELIDRELNGTGSVDYKQYKDTNLLSAGEQKVFNAEPIQIDLGNSAIDGNKAAKVTVVEFVDFQCPFCLRGNETVQSLKKAYGDKIRVVLKHFPLAQIHPHAQKTSEAFECARVQSEEKAWKFHDLLFANQAEWSKAQ